MTMTNVFAVVGQATADPSHLLLLGEDGRFYAYAPDGQPRPADPGDGWRLDDEGTEDVADEETPARARMGLGSRPPERTSR